LKDTQSTCRAIQAATTETQVVALIREYLSSLSAAEVALLPAGLTSLGISHVEEVVQSALQLVHREMLSVLDEPESAFLREASLIFSCAAQRLAALAKHPGETARSAAK
jgi:hypothetical protein